MHLCRLALVRYGSGGSGSGSSFSGGSGSGDSKSGGGGSLSSNADVADPTALWLLANASPEYVP